MWCLILIYEFHFYQFFWLSRIVISVEKQSEDRLKNNLPGNRYTVIVNKIAILSTILNNLYY